MKPVELSDEQRKAIEASGNLVVHAGAGTGKTEVLARRFVALVCGDIAGTEPLLPERIAAITFTEKAAHDMTRRIGEVLDERLANARDSRGEYRLVRARRMLALARISTIHAFCARILRENPMEAGLDPDFEVLDEYESLTFLERNCEKLLVDALRRGHPGAIYLLSARRLRAAGSFREGALEAVLKVVQALGRLGKEPAWILDATRQTANEILAAPHQVRQRALELKELLAGLLAETGLPPKAREQMASVEARWPNYSNLLESFEAATDPSALDLLREICDALPKAQGKIKDRVSAIRKLLCRKDRGIGLGGGLIEAYGLQRAVGPMLDTAALIAEIAQQLEESKRRERVLTFDDLLVRTLRLLRIRPEVTQRLRSAIGAMLIDEFQDTDPIQDSVVRALTEPDAALPAPSLLIVGDEKQSIYRFRGADVSVFRRWRGTKLQLLALRYNRRATPNIISFVNALGAAAMSSKAGTVPEHWVEWGLEDGLRPVRQALGSQQSVELLVTDTACGAEGRTVAGKRGREARAIARRIGELVACHHNVVDTQSGLPRDARFGDIALLMRSFSDVEIYERALREAGIDCYTVKGRGFFGCKEILDLSNLLTTIADARDGIALAAVLRSPLFGLSDQCLLEICLHLHDGASQERHEPPMTLAGLFAARRPDFQWLATERDAATKAWEVLSELRAMRERAPVVEIIERAFELTAFEAVMLGQTQGRQRVANLRKLAELAREFESRRFFSFGDFIAHLRRLTNDPPNEAQAQILGEHEDVVRLMTIHQAKGLEFPVVIVADMGRAPKRDYSKFLLSDERGLLMCDSVGSGRDEIPNPMLDHRQEAIRDQEEAEAARLLYVAITRARDLLILSEGAKTGEWAKQVRSLVGEKRIADFLGSGCQSRYVEVGEAEVLLRRADSLADHQFEAKVVTPPPAAMREDGLEELVRRRLEFTPAGVKELLVSPTALADFARCPRYYLLRHELELAAGGGRADGAGGALEMGLVAHAVLERLGGVEAGSEPPADEIGRLIDQLSIGTSLGPAERTALVHDLSRYLAACKSSSGRERIAGREVPFFLSVGGSGFRLFIRGQIDLLVEDSDTLLVRDYKYAHAAEDGAAYQLQMECYALAAADAHPGRTVRGELIFIRDRTDRLEVKMPAPERIRSHLLAVGRAMIAAKEGGNYPMKPPDPDACRALRCIYVSHCWDSSFAKSNTGRFPSRETAPQQSRRFFK